MRFAVESWSPEYGVAADEGGLDEAGERVDLDVELAAAQWVPIRPRSTPADHLCFVDGVRRIDARVWIGDGARVWPGVCASVAAGAVEANGSGARVIAHRTERVLVASGEAPAAAIETHHGAYRFVPAAGDEPEDQYLAIHEVMTRLEVELSVGGDVAPCVVFDGPLRGRHDPCAVGYVKTQRVQYLDEATMPVVAALAEGERTPLFLIGGRAFTRWSAYLRLPGPRVHPWSGIVRLELPPHGTAADAAARLDVVAATLPRFASAPHKEARAPQNLYPIAGLEQRLRHLLGDPLVLERALRIAAAAAA